MFQYKIISINRFIENFEALDREIRERYNDYKDSNATPIEILSLIIEIIIERLSPVTAVTCNLIRIITNEKNEHTYEQWGDPFSYNPETKRIEREIKYKMLPEATGSAEIDTLFEEVPINPARISGGEDHATYGLVIHKKSEATIFSVIQPVLFSRKMTTIEESKIDMALSAKEASYKYKKIKVVKYPAAIMILSYNRDG